MNSDTCQLCGDSMMHGWCQECGHDEVAEPMPAILEPVPMSEQKQKPKTKRRNARW